MASAPGAAGKTTLVDAMLKQAKVFRDNQAVEVRSRAETQPACPGLCAAAAALMCWAVGLPMVCGCRAAQR